MLNFGGGMLKVVAIARHALGQCAGFGEFDFNALDLRPGRLGQGAGQGRLRRRLVRAG